MDNLQGVNLNSAKTVPVYKTTGASSFNKPLYYNKTLYKQAPDADVFVKSKDALEKKSNPLKTSIDGCIASVAPKAYLNKYINEEVIKNALNKNPEIEKILQTKGIEPEIYIENVTEKNQEHFLTTYKKAKELKEGLSWEDSSILLQASLLHDIGKALIPPEILNKKGKLTKEEKEIVDLHSMLGAEILKTTGVNKGVIEAVSLHHTPIQDPLKQNSEISQILSVSDVYSALKEERPYKKGFTDDTAEEIMQSSIELNQDFVKKAFNK